MGTPTVMSYTPSAPHEPRIDRREQDKLFAGVTAMPLPGSGWSGTVLCSHGWLWQAGAEDIATVTTQHVV